MSFAMIVHQGALPAPSWIAAWLAANAVLAGILRAGTVRLARRLHGQGRLERRVALVGAAEDGRAFLADINRRGCWWHCWCGWTSTGPVLFRQRRIGLGNRPFECLKFRTMYHDMRDVLADRQTTRGDRRVTRVGYWLRRLSLDELPQLLNVLKGEMSLVGPRPHAPNTKAASKLFHEVVAGYARRHRVKPGITGWAQVNGWRGETATEEAIEQRVRHDLHYIQHWSLGWDLRILLVTALRICTDPKAF